MRLLIALLAVLCTIEAVPTSTDLEILRREVRNLKWNVETNIRQIELLRTQAEEDTMQQVLLKWNEEQDSHRTYKTLLISAIRNDINAAETAGKDVDSCYQMAIKGIDENGKTAYNEATKCEYVARDSIHNNLGFIDNLILTAQTLLTELENVFLTCHDSDIYRMQSCVIGELARIKNALRILENDSITAEITIVPVSKNVIMQASNCIKQAYSVTYSGGVAIKLAVSQCIEQTTTTTTTTTTATVPTKATTVPTKTTTKTPTKITS